MLPVFRWSLCAVGALWSCAVWAQGATPQPEVDESKIPEWVKRQARSPYRVIIDSNTVKAKPAAPKEDAAPKTVAKKPPLKATAAPAGAEGDKGTPSLASNAAPAVSANAQPLVAPANAADAAGAPQPLVESALAPAEAPAALSTRATAAEPLTLLKRVEPVLSADLLDSRLNSAKVVVAFTVTAGGEVSNLSIASSTDSRLNRAVLRALQAWRYAPIPEPREHRVSFAFATE